MRSFVVTVLLVSSCASNGKEPSGLPSGAGVGSGASEPGAGSATAAPIEQPPPPDTGGYRLIEPASLSYTSSAPDKPGPQLAVVTGDLKTGAGFFLKVPPGMSAGVHTHSADYHAILISGAHRHWLVGEDKQAKPLLPGSYWFQPGGQPHGDECTGGEPCVLYIVAMGAWDFTPTPKPAPTPRGRYSLVSRQDVKFAPIDPARPQGSKFGIVSGDPKTGPVAFLVESPPGNNFGLHVHTSAYHALVVGGAPAHWLPHEAHEGKPVAAGTYWFQPGGYAHGDRCTGSVACVTFVMMPGALDVKPPPAR